MIEESNILGVDLAGIEKNVTGVAWVDKNKNIFTSKLHTDNEIIEICKNFELIMIDAPLSLPSDRTTIETPGSHFRTCDLILREMKIKFFPITLGPMRKLTERGINIKEKLKSKKVFETFPGAVYDIFGIPRKDKNSIKLFFKNLGFYLKETEYTQDELDAIACLFTGILFIQGKAKIIGERNEIMIIPLHSRP